MKRTRWTCVAITILIVFWLAGCAAQPISDLRVEVPRPAAKDIFIFLDGTGNSTKTPSNVRRLFDLAQAPGSSKNAVVAFYIEGVGGARHPVTGQIAGKGITYRIAASYANLMRVYKPGDRIYIFGFSRGAHIARALGGLLAYAGLPNLEPLYDQQRAYSTGFSAPHSFEDYLDFAAKVNELTRDADEDEYIASYWSKWGSGSLPRNPKNPGESHVDLPLPPLLNVLTPAMDGYKGFSVYGFKPVPIEFIGVWDTVPGSLSRDFSDCREQAGGGKNAKYKSNSYPNTTRIAHAVSRDEKRSRFELLHVCKPIQGFLPEVSEVSFPGAHSDVGGGYVDDSVEWQRQNYELPSISLRWMLGELAKTAFKLSDANIQQAFLEGNKSNAGGLAHWSLSGFTNVLLNDCVDRNLDPPKDRGDRRSVDTIPHESIVQREGMGKVPVLIGDRTEDNQPLMLRYPITCSDYEDDFKQAAR